MKRSIVAAAALFAAPAALAQVSSTTTTTTTTVTPQQQTAIKTYVTKEKRKSVVAPSGFTVTTGAVVPEAVELYSFPADVGVTHRYTVIGDRTVVVDPGSRRVIQVID